LDLDVTNKNRLYLLLDGGADVSLPKSKKLIRMVTFKPRDKVKIKSADGSVTETHGATETRIREGYIEVPFTFQLVSQQNPRMGFPSKEAGQDMLRNRNLDVSAQGY
jgi:hypothetical protein